MSTVSISTEAQTGRRSRGGVIILKGFAKRIIQACGERNKTVPDGGDGRVS